MFTHCFTSLFGQSCKRAFTGAAVALSLVGFISMPASADTVNTLNFSGVSWNDGGSLNGSFAILYDNSGMPISVLTADVVTGNGATDGFVGYTYLYGVNGQSDTVSSASIDATQSGGAAANEMTMSTNDGRHIFLDWLGSTPATLAVGNLGSEFSSESYNDAPGLRYLATSSVPEPSAMLLLGSGLVGLSFVRRLRKRAS